MKGYDLGLGDFLMEVDIEDENDRTSEAENNLKEIVVTKEEAKIAKEEAELAKVEAIEAAKQSKLLLEEITLKKQKLDEIPDTVPDTTLEIYVSDTVENDRDIKALELLEEERQMQIERKLIQAEKDAEWLKEKRSKKIKRMVKTSAIAFIVGVIGLALLAGYRIPISEDVVIHFKGIWESAKDFVIQYWVNR